MNIIFVYPGYTECGRLGIGPYNPKNPYVVTPQLVQGLNNIIKVPIFFYKTFKYLLST